MDTQSKPPHVVMLDVSDMARYYALTEALRDFADRNEYEADDAGNDAGEQLRAESLREHAAAARGLLDDLDQQPPFARDSLH